jgi:hypothetical protein
MEAKYNHPKARVRGTHHEKYDTADPIKVHPVQAVRPIGGVEVLLYFFMATALEGVRGQRHALAAFYPRERPGTHCAGGWVGPRAGLDRCGKSRPHRDSIPGPSSP